MNISTSTIAQGRRKPTQNIIDDEDASELKLGPEFDITQITHDGTETPLITLNLSETRLLINTALRQRRREENAGNDMDDVEDNDNDDEEDFSNSNEVLRKTQEYLSIFARFRDEQTVSAVEHLLKSPENANLHPFEVAQLGKFRHKKFAIALRNRSNSVGSLACEEAEEAKTLIASLGDKKSDQELQVLLDQVSHTSARLWALFLLTVF